MPGPRIFNYVRLLLSARFDARFFPMGTNIRDSLSGTSWCLVISAAGAVAVVAEEDLEDLNKSLGVIYMANIGDLEARLITSSLLPHDCYMSANHRLKPGESGGVG